MIPSKHLKSVGRFVTTYCSDYKPFSERHPRVNQLHKHRPGPSFLSPPQTDRETWPIFHQYFYKTTNSIYGSSGRAQPPSSSLFPASLPPFGILAPSVSEASRVVGSTPTKARTQEEGVARETRLVLGEEENGQLHYGFCGKANALEQQEAEDEPQQKMDVLYEEGMIVLSSYVDATCCEDFFRSVCREAGLQHLLPHPVASSPIITSKDAENWDGSAYLRGLRPTLALKNSTFFQPTSRQCSCCVWETKCPNSCCFKMQSFASGIPSGSTLPLAHVQPTVYSTEPRRKPLLTEYQASYTAEWAQPKIQQSDFHHQHPPHQQIIYRSF